VLLSAVGFEPIDIGKEDPAFVFVILVKEGGEVLRSPL
jgi:hypothetical protein